MKISCPWCEERVRNNDESIFHCRNKNLNNGYQCDYEDQTKCPVGAEAIKTAERVCLNCEHLMQIGIEIYGCSCRDGVPCGYFISKLNEDLRIKNKAW